MENVKIKHPAVYSDQFIEIFSRFVKPKSVIYDPFAGTGKIALIKEYVSDLFVICNDLEPEYEALKKYDVDRWYHEDAETCIPGFVDFIITSPTYGNRMADSHNAKDKSKRITYTHQLGRKLHDSNTGKMQWGKDYQKKHEVCYAHFYTVLSKGLFILNVSDHIRKGKAVNVCDFHIEAALKAGFKFEDRIKVSVKRMRFGQNHSMRISHEEILIFKKS